jgi:integrase
MKTEYLLNKEVDRVLACLTESNQLVCRTILQTGLRLGDVLKLRKDQLKNQFWITEEKTGKRRRVSLPNELLWKLQGVAGVEWVFEHRTNHKKHRTRQAVYADVKRAARAFRLQQNVAPHSFRKAYAVELLAKYGDIDRVRRALNHESITTTVIYALSDKLLTARKSKKKKSIPN